ELFPISLGASTVIQRGINNTLQSPDFYLWAYLPVGQPVIDEDDPSTYIYVRIEVSTTSQIDWKTLDDKFKPYVHNVTDDEKYYITPSYQTYSNQLTSYYESTFNSSGQVKINNYFDLAQCDAEKCKDRIIYLIVKDQNGKIPNATNGHSAKFRYIINSAGIVYDVKQYANSGGMIDIAPSVPSYINVSNGLKLYFEYYTEEKLIADKLNKYQNTNNDLMSFGGTVPKSNYTQGQSNYGLYKANIFSNENIIGIGSLYRNWGQFSYKG